MRLRLLKEADVSGKTVFLRADLDVPISEGRRQKVEDRVIEDETRLVAALPTIEYLLNHNARVIVGGHLGRPILKNQKSKIKNQKEEKERFSLEPVARWLYKNIKSQKSNIKYTKIGDFGGWRIADDLFLLENLRFYRGEEGNDKEFAKRLARLADVYVNDAFAVSHRNHASVVGITKFLPSFIGFHLEKEVSILSKISQNPRRPLVVLIGGKKIETKLPLVARMYTTSDYVLVGGKIAGGLKDFLKIEHKKTKGRKAILLVADLNSEREGIMENSLNNFVEIISLAKTIVWNGTMGKVADGDDFNHASRRIAKAIVDSKAYSVVGGGDTTEFLRKIKMIDKFSFVSTGGGAMLAYLSGENLPGLAALKA